MVADTKLLPEYARIEVVRLAQALKAHPHHGWFAYVHLPFGRFTHL
jgi:hypothetical protein